MQVKFKLQTSCSCFGLCFHSRITYTHYIGKRVKTGEVVAMKQINLFNVKEKDKRSLLKEIDILSKLDHRNIVKYIGKLRLRVLHQSVISKYRLNREPALPVHHHGVCGQGQSVQDRQGERMVFRARAIPLL